MTTILERPTEQAPESRRRRRRLRVQTQPVTGSTLIGLRVLYGLSGLMIWALTYALLFGALSEARSQHVLYAQFRQQLAIETAPLGGAISAGEPVALIAIPRLGVRDVIVEGTSGSDLLLGPGHRSDSPLPGEVGVSVLYGRGATFGAPFRSLTKLRPGDKMTLVDGAGSFQYIVQDLRRAGSQLPQPVTAGTSRVTLATATGSGWRAGWAPSEPFYVDATMVGTASAEPGGHVASVPAEEKLMASGTGALGSLVRWLQLLAVVTVLAAWAFSRWGRWQAWLVGVPTVMAALWIVSETAVRLLPNTL